MLGSVGCSAVGDEVAVVVAVSVVGDSVVVPDGEVVDAVVGTVSVEVEGGDSVGTLVPVRVDDGGCVVDSDGCVVVDVFGDRTTVSVAVGAGSAVAVAVGSGSTGDSVCGAVGDCEPLPGTAGIAGEVDGGAVGSDGVTPSSVPETSLSTVVFGGIVAPSSIETPGRIFTF